MPEGQIEKLETMAKLGEIELSIPEEPAPEPEVPEGQPSTVKLGGKEYSEEEVLTLLEKGRNADNDERWQARNTQRSMALADKERQLNEEREKIRQEYEEMRKGTDDPATQKIINLLEIQHKRSEALEQTVMQQRQELQNQKDLSFIMDQKAKAESVLGEKLPDMGTPEFEKLIELAANGNRLQMAYLMTKKLPKKPLPNLKNEAVQPEAPAASEEMERAIAASGLDPDYVKSLM